jgi:hypothetical protein
MRVLKRVLCIGFVTLVALVYVHQQVELVKLSYTIGCKEKALKDGLDRNADLSYTIENLEDPSRLEQVLLAKNIDVTMPRHGNIVRVARLDRVRAQDSFRDVLTRNVNIASVLDLFSSKAEAQTRDR